jgi:hypothetical protein
VALEGAAWRRETPIRGRRRCDGRRTIAPYDEERRNALEEAHGAEYVFKRRGDALDVVKLVPAAPRLEGVSFEQRSARRLGKLLNVLVERAIEKHLASSKVSIVRRRPLKLVSLEPKNDIAHGLFGAQTQGRLPLHVRRGFS